MSNKFPKLAVHMTTSPPDWLSTSGYEKAENILDAYKKHTDKTAVYPAANTGGLAELSYLALGLAGETGEAVDVIKKMVRSERIDPDRINKLIDELGDVLWYWIRLVNLTGTTPEQVIARNVTKLAARLVAGTLKERSGQSVTSNQEDLQYAML